MILSKDDLKEYLAKDKSALGIQKKHSTLYGNEI